MPFVEFLHHAFEPATAHSAGRGFLDCRSDGCSSPSILRGWWFVKLSARRAEEA